MSSLFQDFINGIWTKVFPIWKKIKLFTNPGFLKNKIFKPLFRFIGRMVDLRPKDEQDYYSFFGWLISKRLAFVIVLMIGLTSVYYMVEIQPLSVFVSDESGIKTYKYDSIPLRFTKGRVRILGKSGYVAYEGNVKNGVAVGNGTLYRKDSSKVYEGEFEDNQFQGEGTSYYPTGQVKYLGNFHHNLYSGNGSLYRKNGSLEYTGSFFEGKKDGTGTLYDSGNNAVYIGNFYKDQLLYSDFIGKSTKEATQMYLGKKNIYTDDTQFVVDMRDIEAVIYGNQQAENLTDEIMVEGIFVLKDSFGYSGQELKTIFEVNQYLGEAVYEGNTYASMPEAVAIHIINQNETQFNGEMIAGVEQYLSDAYTVNEYEEDFELYIYTYVQEDMRYTFFCKDRSGKFSMYQIERTDY